ncbi:alpha/beta-hydrolase [Dentipellis sp. KUC8613]|nr:alpha/beta-hydrolase [Dentipellis sp. KUC8613]
MGLSLPLTQLRLQPAMDALAAIVPTDIPSIYEPTTAAANALHEPHRASIESIPRRRFKYGPDERHNLDVYYPPPSESKVPVLVYIHGGAFVAGAARPMSLVYANLGAHFARTAGALVLVPEYRLAPGAQYPAGAADVRSALEWAVSHAREIAEEDGGEGERYDWERVWLSGHSAGAIHAATILLDPAVLPLDDPLRARIKKLVLLAAPMHFRSENTGPGPLMYYGSPEAIETHQPLALLENASPEVLRALPGIYMVEAERDPEFVKAGAEDWRVAFGERVGAVGAKGELVVVRAAGHNHLSLVWFIGGGEAGGDGWVEGLIRWLQH